jgi:acyl-CoA thioesterase
MLDIANFIRERDRFARHVGIELLEMGEGTARARLVLNDSHLNGIGVTHGGAIFALADLAFAAASNSRGTAAVAINANISYMRATSEGALYAQAREISVTPRLATYTVEITDEQGNVVAIFQGMVYRKKETLDEIAQHEHL